MLKLILVCIVFILTIQLSAQDRDSTDKGWTLGIIHTADIAGQLEPFILDGETPKPCGSKPDECYGGLVNLNAKIQELRKKADEVIVVDSGGFLGDTKYFNRLKGGYMGCAAKLLGYDFLGISPQDLKNGVKDSVIAFQRNLLSENFDENCKKYIDKPPKQDRNTTLLLSNKASIEHLGVATPDMDSITSASEIHIIHSKNNFTIGIVSYIGSLDKTSETPMNIKIENFETSNKLKESIQSINHCDLKVVLGSGGIDNDKKLAKKYSDLHVIVGSGSKTFLNNDPKTVSRKSDGNYPEKEGNTEIVHSYIYGKYVGFLMLKFDENNKLKSTSGNTEIANPSNVQEETIKTFIKKGENLIEAQDNIELAVTKDTLFPIKTECERKQCVWGNFINKAILWEVNKDVTISSKDEFLISIFPMAQLKDVSATKITEGVILDMITDNAVVAGVEMKAVELKDFLETQGLKFLINPTKGSETEESDKFVQIAGVKINYYDEQIQEMSVLRRSGLPLWEPMDFNSTSTTYRVLFSQAIIKSMYGFNFKLQPMFYSQNSLRDILIKYLKRMELVSALPLDVIIVSDPPPPPPTTKPPPPTTKPPPPTQPVTTTKAPIETVVPEEPEASKPSESTSNNNTDSKSGSDPGKIVLGILFAISLAGNMYIIVRGYETKRRRKRGSLTELIL